MIQPVPERRFSLFDSTCITVGIIIGAGIYESAPMIARGVPGTFGVLGIWLLGGILSLAGALCYAELASAYPRSGGDYVFLSRAYGRWAGHLFAWSQCFVIRPGDIALMAFVVGSYARTLGGPFAHSRVVNACVAVVALTAINLLGVRQGKRTQNILTTVKALGLLGIVVAACTVTPAPAAPNDPGEFQGSGARLSLILVLFTFGGWNDVAYVAAEVKDPGRTIVRSLVAGMAVVTGLYLLVNGAFLYSLGHAGMSTSEAVAVDTVQRALPQGASVAVAVLVCVSALGAMNGLILTGARIYYALGKDHGLFRWLGRWNERPGTPISALALQGLLSLGMILALRSFEQMLLYTAPVVWLFFLATGLSLLVLRRKDAATPRPYPVTGYPFVPLLFCACCVFLMYSSTDYALLKGTAASLVAFGIVLLGLPVYWIGRKLARNPQE